MQTPLEAKDRLSLDSQKKDNNNLDSIGRDSVELCRL